MPIRNANLHSLRVNIFKAQSMEQTCEHIEALCRTGNFHLSVEGAVLD